MLKRIKLYVFVVLLLCFSYHSLAQNLSQYKGGVKRGDAGAMYNLASYYFNSPDGNTGNYAEALKLYEKAASKGHQESMYMAAYMYYNGIGTSKDIRKSLGYAEDAYRNGFKPSALLLAEAIKDGNYESKAGDYYNYLSIAANCGLVNAQTELGIECLNGDEPLGVKMNKELGSSWIKKAADKDDPRAQYYMGLCYEKGWGVGRADNDKAYSFYQSSARNGYPYALARMGERYLSDGNYFEAYQCFDQAKGKDDGESYYKLGQMFLNGIGVERNPQKAFNMFLEGAKASHAESQCGAAELYLTGNGTAKNLKEAFRLFKESSETGLARALCGVGVCYRDGIGTEIDNIKAYSNIKKSYEKKYAPAQEELARCYWDGIGIAVDKKQAIALFESAARSGSLTAEYQLGEIFFFDKDFRNYVEAHNVLQKLIADEEFEDALDNEKKGNAYHHLGAMYYFGYGVIKDEVQCLYYFEKAKSYGNDDADEFIKLKQAN